MNTLFDSALSAAITVLLQSTVILGTALVLARCLHRNSSLRYPVLLSALVITLLSAGWAVWNPGRTQGILIQASAADPGPTVAPPAAETGAALISSTPQIVSVDPPAVAEEALRSSPDRERPTTPPIAASASTDATWLFPWRWAGGTLLLLWLSGSLLLLVRLLAGLHGVRRLLRNASPLPAHEARRVWNSVAGEFGADDKVPPPILLSPDIATPVVVGAVRSKLLLPASLLSDLDESRLRAVLAHEFAHIIRRDTLVGLVERWAQIFLWPQPLLGIFLRTLDRSREEICDNYALTVSDRHSYGSLLLTLSDAEAPRTTPPPRLVAMGLLRGHWSLEQRISDLLNPNRNTMTKATLRHWIAPTAAIATIALMLGSTRITFAAPEDEREEKSERRERAEKSERREREEKSERREREEKSERREREEKREGGDRERGERGERDGFDAQVRELKAAMHEAAERGQKERAQKLENKLKELFAHREGKGRERDERKGEERREGDHFEAEVRELKAAMHEAAERGQKERAQQLENKLKDLFAHREGKGRERDEHKGEERREGDHFEAQVRELKAAMHKASERGQEDRAHQIELKLKELLAHHEREREGGDREREERGERREGGNLEGQIRELKYAMREADERGQKDRAHQLELKLKELLAHREREREGGDREREERGEHREKSGDERAVHLERRLHEMAKHVEEMQRAMQEMQRELERMRKNKDR